MERAGAPCPCGRRRFERLSAPPVRDAACPCRLVNVRVGRPRAGAAFTSFPFLPKPPSSSKPFVLIESLFGSVPGRCGKRAVRRFFGRGMGWRGLVCPARAGGGVSVPLGERACGGAEGGVRRSPRFPSSQSLLPLQSRSSLSNPFSEAFPVGGGRGRCGVSSGEGWGGEGRCAPPVREAALRAFVCPARAGRGVSVPLGERACGEAEGGGGVHLVSLPPKASFPLQRRSSLSNPFSEAFPVGGGRGRCGVSSGEGWGGEGWCAPPVWEAALRAFVFRPARAGRGVSVPLGERACAGAEGGVRRSPRFPSS